WRPRPDPRRPHPARLPLAPTPVQSLRPPMEHARGDRGRLGGSWTAGRCRPGDITDAASRAGPNTRGVGSTDGSDRAVTDGLRLSVLQREAYDIAVARGQWPRGCRATVAVPSVLATVARRAIGEETTELAAALSRWERSGGLDAVAD